MSSRPNKNSSKPRLASDNLSMGTVDDRDEDDLQSDHDAGSGSVRERLLKNGNSANAGSDLYQNEQQEESVASNDPDEYKRNRYISRLHQNNCFFTPGWILAIFTLVNTFTYYDRGSISASASFIATDHSIAGNTTLSQAETGALYSVFMVGYFVFSPLCVGMGGTLSCKAIIIFGIACWCGAVVLAGLSNSYPLLMFARALTGIGEAAYSGFTVTIVDNVCPKESRTKWIGTFFATIPAGTAAGIAINGIIVSHRFGNVDGWRMGFFMELVPMLVLLIIVCFLPKEYNVRPEDRGDDEIAAAAEDADHIKRLLAEQRRQRAGDESESEDEKAPEEQEAEAAGSHVPLPMAVRQLFCNANFMFLSFGYAAYTFVLGSISFFAISMLTEGPMNVSEVDASLLLGATTAILGLVGAVVGGVLVDRWGGSKGWEGVYKCALLLTVCMIISVPCGFILLSISNFKVFCVIFVFAIWWLFLITAPLNTALLTVVPANLRPYSVAVSVLLMHLFGDFPATPLTGAIADAYDGGCKNFDDDEVLCLTHNTTIGYCKFIPKPSAKENSRCVNAEELSIALRFSWTVMIFSIPLWAAVAYRVKKHKSVFGHHVDHHLHHHHQHHDDRQDDSGNAPKIE